MLRFSALFNMISDAKKVYILGTYNLSYTKKGLKMWVWMQLLLEWFVYYHSYYLLFFFMYCCYSRIISIVQSWSASIHMIFLIVHTSPMVPHYATMHGLRKLSYSLELVHDMVLWPPIFVVNLQLLVLN